LAAKRVSLSTALAGGYHRALRNLVEELAAASNDVIRSVGRCPLRLETVIVEFVATKSVEECVAVLSRHGDDARLLAGGTDVMMQLQRGDVDPGILVHIEGIESLRDITMDNDTVRLGALVTHRQVSRSPQLSSGLPALAEASATVGGWQTQEVGTVVGNVCNASPAADTLPPLLIADTRVELTGPRGSRTVPLTEFVTGRRRISRYPDELVTALALQPARGRSGEVYLKVGPRSGMEVALVGLALRLTLDDNDVVTDARLAVCSVAPVPYRVKDAEQVLIGSTLDDEAIGQAGAVLAASATPIDDPRATASYRMRVLPGLLARAAEIGAMRARAKG
jgi:aerobic carbon-monoxide dehydrogenase medium subunit